MKKRWIALLILLLVSILLLYGQEIVTAERYLEIVSDHYVGIRDYEANIVIRSGGQDMTGSVSNLSPSFLRIDFTRPSGQVICFNGEVLNIYIPDYRAVLSQNVAQSRRNTTASGAALASSQGLSLLRRNYVASFVTGPNPEPLDPGSSERVVKLRLTRRTTAEGFREIILSINPDTLLIRRIEGRTIADVDIRFDFTNIRTNVGIPEQRFVYDPPVSASTYYNFLFRDIE